jgi:hypothetical protein
LQDPIMTAIATAIAGSAAQSLTTQTSHILAEIINRLRSKFRDREADLAALIAAEEEPESHAHVTRLAESLHQVSVDDPAFGAGIARLWRQHLMVSSDVNNIFQGKAEKVVQLRDIHGDLNLS